MSDTGLLKSRTKKATAGSKSFLLLYEIFNGEIKTSFCWKSSKRIFRPFPDLRAARRKKKERENSATSARYQSLLHRWG